MTKATRTDKVTTGGSKKIGFREKEIYSDCRPQKKGFLCSLVLVKMYRGMAAVKKL